MIYEYKDEYLNKRVTEDREQRAIEEVLLTGITDEEYKKRLSILKCYIITALECSSDSDDIFSQKLKIYQKEYQSLLNTAKSQLLSTTGDSLFSIELERA